ncbi:MAG: hypothetical protein CMK64_14120 [Pseudoalteromonas sp.]|nr:hypothetical protein [Pseudoalteromonas sp.]
MIGCGAQSEFQILAFKAILGVTHVRLYDIEPNATKKCFNNLQSYSKENDLNIEICHSSEEVIKGADIITTCTADKRNATILKSDMVGEGVHINAIGGDCPGKTELDAALLNRSDVFVEYEPQTRIEGDIQQLPSDSKVTEMYQVILGEKSGRTHDAQLTIFDGVGFALEDYSALRFIFELVKQNKEAQQIELLASPQDPRNLFGLTQTHSAQSASVLS